MKKYLVIGNPIKHSLSPKLHNYWIKNNNLDAIYDRRKLNEKELESLILDIKSQKIIGINAKITPIKIIIFLFFIKKFIIFSFLVSLLIVDISSSILNHFS